MRKLLMVLSFMAALGMVAAPAALAHKTGFKKKAGYKKKKAYIFKGDNIWGEIIGSDDIPISAAMQPPHPTLIEYRLDFKPEMLKLTEEL